MNTTRLDIPQNFLSICRIDKAADNRAGGFSTVAFVQIPGEVWAERKSCPQTPDTLRRMNLELHLLEGARTHHVANILWALST